MSSADNIKELLAKLKLEDGTKQALETIAAKLKTDNDDDEEAEDALSNVVLTLSDITATKARQLDRLTCYEFYLDQKLPDFLAQLDAKITNQTSAMAAVKGFDLDFFRNMPMSADAKQQIASTLINLTNRFNAGDNQFWHSLVAGNVDVLDMVSFHIDITSVGIEG